MPDLAEVVKILEGIAPTANAESWDNVGLLVGDLKQIVNKAMLTIDYTAAVAEEASRAGCDLIVAYHPPIFHPIKTLTADSLIFDAIRRNVAIYSPHTALDIAEGGTNDMLADAIGLVECAPLRLTQPASTRYKLVAFVPEDQTERISNALFEAGAGQIGKYSSCSFLLKGTGTFFGESGTNPAVGQHGKLERQPEIRLETIVPISQIEQVIQALRATHPYEEPAFDLNLLAAAPEGIGQGRVGTMPATPRPILFDRLKKNLGIRHLMIAGPTEGDVTKAAVCGGSCGDLLDDAIRANVDLYVTGEMRHHDAIKASNAGITVICTLHSNSERAVLPRLKKRMEEALPDFPIAISRADRDPFAIS